MDLFDYDLPDEAVAQEPAEPRDAARLLVDANPPRHGTVADLPDLLRAGDVLVINDSKVLPARLHLRKATGGTVEVLLLEPVDGDDRWEALVRPGRKVRPGTTLVAGPDLEVEVGEVLGDGRRLVRVRAGDDGLLAALERHGEVPLPPYIHAPLADVGRYQTVYAERPSSVAAPTAGLHLTPEVLERCRAEGVRIERVELAVGLATFRPVTAERVEDHVMHTERYRVPAATMEACRAADRVVAIGTTTVRALESAAVTGELEGRTSLFIRRGFEFQVVDALLTNFHLPRSSLLLLIDAFVGDRWRALYELALRERYRFLSFGDAMLLFR